MRPQRAVHADPLPQTRNDLQVWVRRQLALAPSQEAALFEAIDAVFSRHERLWQESKQDAISALCAGFAEKMARASDELEAKDATVSSIAHYFEQLVADLTDKSQRDPKTKLMNFSRFTDQLESFLALEQRGRWCAVGLVDITQFKWYNDALGHAVGDQIIMRVAQLLREQVRSEDILAQERPHRQVRELHARFGGDEFCFLIPDLPDHQQAYAVGERFREAVERYDWAIEDARLAAKPVRVDVGVVCLRLGRVNERRLAARRVADSLIQRADELMYAAKGRHSNHIHFVCVRLENGELVEIDSQQPALPLPDNA
jgi:diguanylate cyclase (GGDEF)-like protein